MEDKDRQAVTALLVVQVLFGLFPVAAKKVFPYLDPGPILALRVTGAAFCLMALHLVFVKNPVPILRMPGRIVVLTLLGVVLNMGLFMVGIQHTTATEAVLVITSIPVFTYAIAVALGRERLGPRRAYGILLAIAGVAVLTTGAAFEGGAHLLGDLLVLGNALSYAAFLVLARPLTHEHDPLSLVTWIFVLGSFVFLPIGLAQGLRGQLGDAPTSAMLWMVFIIVGATVLTYGLNTLALRHVSASTVAAFTYVQPVFTAVAAFFLLDERPDWRLVPAAMLVFAGVWLVARREPDVLQGQVVAD